MPTRTPHHDRALGAIRLVDPGGTDETPEALVPRERLRIDTVRVAGAWEGVDETYAQHLRYRRQVIELTGRSLTLRAAVNALSKAYNVLNEWHVDRATGPRPELVVVAHSARNFVASLDAREVAPGMCVHEPQGLLRVVTIELGRVPLQNGTTGLHIMRWPSDTGDDTMLRRFLDDPTVPESIRRHTWEAIMVQQLVATEDERGNSYDWVLEKGRNEGRREGRREGRSEGRNEGRREALLDLARALLGSERAAALDEIADGRAFERAVLDAVREQ